MKYGIRVDIIIALQSTVCAISSINMFVTDNSYHTTSSTKIVIISRKNILIIDTTMAVKCSQFTHKS